MQNGGHRNDLLGGFGCKNRKYPFRVHIISTTIFSKSSTPHRSLCLVSGSATAAIVPRNPPPQQIHRLSLKAFALIFQVYSLSIRNFPPCALIWHSQSFSSRHQIN
jgi:hypothetical protein